MSFRIYLSSISMICNFEQFMHMGLIYVMLHRAREIRKGELQRHKNKEQQSYSDNVLFIVSLTYPLDRVE